MIQLISFELVNSYYIDLIVLSRATYACFNQFMELQIWLEAI